MTPLLRFDNPFHDLWVTEILDPNSFVSMFSPTLVSDAEAIFANVNVVVKGRSGSGKSMLLKLLFTSTRLAYALSGVKYPVPQNKRMFLAAGIQLTKENASHVAARANEFDENVRHRIIAENFSDYLNNLLCSNIIENILYLAKAQKGNAEVIPEVRVDLGDEAQKNLFTLLSKSEAWRGIVPETAATIEKLKEEIENRLTTHRKLMNGRIDKFPPKHESSRSTVGRPMKELATALRASGLLPSETLIMLIIDQHEELFELEQKSGLGTVFRRVINSLLAQRDSSVAYRIGTRHYAWDSDVSSWDSGAPIEHLRDYDIVDLDIILGRKEHAKGWKFPSFARDVFEKRLTAVGLAFSGNPMDFMFDKSLEPAARAQKYAGSAKSLVEAETWWAPEWKAYLNKLWDDGQPLEAKFGETWLRQQSQIKRKIPQDGSKAHGTPWRSNKWWVKERNEICLMQLAGKRQQALKWSGERQIIELAGYNILAFMTICKEIWSTWQRRNPSEAETKSTLPQFSFEDQAIGINEASKVWFAKIQTGLQADERTKLISALGAWFGRSMRQDKATSNPGHSGFSLVVNEFSQNTPLVGVIKACRDRGDLIESPHTTRYKDQLPRLKWYLHPLLCPMFRIPYIRTKEPIYTTLDALQKLYDNQKRIGALVEDVDVDSPQLGLPGM